MRLVNLVLDKRAWVPIGPGSFIAIQGQSVRPVWHEISEDGGQPSCLGSPASREGGGPLKKQKKTRPWIRVASFFFLEMTPPWRLGCQLVLPLPLRLPTQLGLLARSEIATDELALPKEPTDLGYWARSQGVLSHLSAG